MRADGPYEKNVAVKIVRGGFEYASALGVSAMNGEFAPLDHPNIARLLDGGATGEGVPFIVMELRGTESNRRFLRCTGLGVPERLKLFRRVCPPCNTRTRVWSFIATLSQGTFS